MLGAMPRRGSLEWGAVVPVGYAHIKSQIRYVCAVKTGAHFACSLRLFGLAYHLCQSLIIIENAKSLVKT